MEAWMTPEEFREEMRDLSPPSVKWSRPPPQPTAAPRAAQPVGGGA